MPDYRKFQKNITPWNLEVPMLSDDCTVNALATDEKVIIGAGKNGFIPVYADGKWKQYFLNKKIDLYGVAIGGEQVCFVGSFTNGTNVGSFAAICPLVDLVAGKLDGLKNQISGNGIWWKVIWHPRAKAFVVIHYDNQVWMKSDKLWKLIVDKKIRAPRSIAAYEGNSVLVGRADGTVYQFNINNPTIKPYECSSARELLVINVDTDERYISSGRTITLNSNRYDHKELAKLEFAEKDTGEVGPFAGTILGLAAVYPSGAVGVGSDGLTYTIHLVKEEAYRESFFPSKGTFTGVTVFGEKVFACGSGIHGACIVSKAIKDFNFCNYWEVGDKPAPVEPTPEPKPIEPPVESPVIPPVPNTEPEPDEIPTVPVEPIKRTDAIDEKVMYFGYAVLNLLHDAKKLQEFIDNK